MSQHDKSILSTEEDDLITFLAGGRISNPFVPIQKQSDNHSDMSSFLNWQKTLT